MPEVEDLLRRVVRSAREFKAYLALLMVQTEDLIDQRWAYVEAFARALCERGTLKREDIESIAEDLARKRELRV